MADINEIISKAGIDSVTRAKEELEKANREIEAAIVNSKKLSDTMVGAKTMGQLNKDAQAAMKAQEQLLTLTARRELAEKKLAQFEEQAAAKRLAAEQKQIAADEKALAILERKRKARFQDDASVTNGAIRTSGTTVNKSDIDAGLAASQAAAIPIIQHNTKAVDDNASAKKRLAFEALQAKEAEKANATALRNSVKEANAAKGSLEQRQLALARLQKTYTQLNVAERGSPFGQRLEKTIGQLNTQVITLEKTALGKSGRNVGNYPLFNGIQQGASKAFSAVRTLANILPGVGVAGLIGFAVEPIIDYISQLDVFKTKIGEVAAVGGAISSEYKKAVSDVAALGTTLNEFRDGTINRDEVVKRFNETIGQTVGELKTVQQVEDFYNKQSAAFVQATLLRAQAQAALNVATEKNSEALKRQIEGPTYKDYLKSIGSAFVDTFQGIAPTIGSIINNAGLSQIIDVGALRKSGNEAAKEYEKLQKKADEFAKQNGLNFRGNEKNSREKQGKDLQKILRDNQANEIQSQIDTEKKRREIFDKQLSNEEMSYETRIEARNNFYESSIRIAELEAEKERKLQELTDREIKDGKKVSNEEKLAIDRDFALKVEQLNNDLGKKTTEIFNSNNATLERIRETSNQRTLSILERQRDEELTSLANQYNQRGNFGVKAQEEYEKQRLDIAHKYALEEIRLAIEQTQQLINIRKLQGADITSEEAKLASLRLKYQDEVTKNGEKNADRQVKKEQEKLEKLKEIGLELLEFGKSVSNSIFEGNIQNLEKEKRLDQERKDQEIENINKSLLTEEQKQDRIAIIQAQSEERQRQIDQRIAAQKRKQAIADKAFALAQIAINTAIAISKVAAQTGIFALAGIGPIIALGALQAATVLAQPIPEFRHGGTMEKDGFARFGEVGRELRINPDGSTELTPASSTVGWVEAGTKFINAQETQRLMAKPSKIDHAGKSWEVGQLVNETRNSATRIEKAVSKMTTPSTMITRHGFHNQNIKTTKLNAYLKRNLK